MDLTRCLLLGVLVLGLLHSGLCKPSAKPAAADDDDYANDDDYVYADEDNSAGAPSSERANSIESNNVIAPVVFNPPAYETSVRIGENALLECKPENQSMENLIIMWYNDTQLLFQSSTRVTNDQRLSLVDGSSTLSIEDVTSHDQGQYRCVVQPSKAELKIRLNVHMPPQMRIFNAEGRDVSDTSVTLQQGEQYQMECRASRAPEPVISWSADGQRVVSGQNGVRVSGAVLTIERADHVNVRKYRCLGDNGDSAGHVGVNINVKYTPKVGSHHRIVNTLLGEHADLHCDYNTSGSANVQWRKDRKLIDAAADPAKYRQHDEQRHNFDAQHHRMQLQVRNVQLSDLGLYDCEVSNGLGSGSTAVLLTLKPEQPRFVSVDLGEGKALTHWTIRSHQPLSEVEIKYMKEGESQWVSEKPIHHEKSKEHSAVWKIQYKLNLSKPGKYVAQVKASNGQGWSEFSEVAHITVPEFDFSESEPLSTEELPGNKSSDAPRFNRSPLFALFALTALLVPMLRRA